MSTLDINNYSNHRPMTMIYQNLDIVSEGSADRTAAVLIGSQGKPGFNGAKTESLFDGKTEPGIYIKNNPGLILIRSQADIDRKLRNKSGSFTTPTNDAGENPLADAAEIALVAGGGDPFYCITTTIFDYKPVIETKYNKSCFVYQNKEGTITYYKSENVFYKEKSDKSGLEEVASVDENNLVEVRELEANENWDSAKKVLKNNDRTLFVCPITRNIELQKGIISACEELSQPDIQRWKRCYIGLATNTFSLSSYNDKNNGFFVKAASSEAGTKITDEAFKGSKAYYKVGEEFKLLYEDEELDIPLTIDRCGYDSDGIYYYSGYDQDGNVKAIEAKNLKANEIYYQTLVNKLASDQGQRTCLIWSPGAYSVYANKDGELVENRMPPEQLAAGITALRASILPQQGLSRRVLPWIYQIPASWGEFDQQMLDQIATTGGVFIVTQDDPDSEVYIRHQLTSDLNRGILYYEDSVGVNVDTICYGLKDIVKGYVGQRNNTSDTLLEIKNRVADYLLSLTSTGVSIDARRIGPQISQVDLESMIVKLDDNFKDRVIISVDIVVPVPLNQIHVHLNAFASLSNTNATNA